MPFILVILTILIALFWYLFNSGPKLSPETDAIIDEVLHSDLSDVITGETGYATSDGLQIWYENILPEQTPKGTILLIISQAGNALGWHPAFVRALVESGYQVIRFDNRGTGLSDWMENWSRKNPYTITDMAGDALAVMDTLNAQKVHIIGLSMGGMIAQEVAINYPERVASLTLMMTSGFIGDPDLPTLTSRYLFTSLIQGIPLLKYRLIGGEKNLIKEPIAKTLAFLGKEGLDIRELARVTLYDLRHRRGINMRAGFQHQVAVMIAGSRYEKLKKLHVPTLVIHGTADPLIPVEHGRKLVEIIPNAEAVWLEDVGHVFLPQDMETFMHRIFAHLDNSQT